MAEHPKSPLAGKRIVITRPESQSAALSEALRAVGAQVALLPLIRIEPPYDLRPLDAALGTLHSFAWLILTSQNAVTAVADRLTALGITVRLPRIAAVGRSTADAAKQAGFTVTHTGHGTAADLVRELASDLASKRILLPRSDRAAAALSTQLKNTGAQVTEVVAYRTVAIAHAGHGMGVRAADAILFFSPSAVNAFSVLLKSGVCSPIQSYGAVGAIGPVTRAALLQAGIPCHFEAQRPSLHEIVWALTGHFADKFAPPRVHSR